MYGLKADYTLLFFYNPDCHTCIEIKNAMKRSLLLKELVANGRMKVLTLYPDEDVALWRQHLNELSDEWKAIMAEVCKYYHIVNIELKDIEKQNRHPNRKGMRQIVEQLAEELK